MVKVNYEIISLDKEVAIVCNEWSEITFTFCMPLYNAMTIKLLLVTHSHNIGTYSKPRHASNFCDFFIKFPNS